MSERDNYFILLDLDPSVDDPAVIERAILDKKRAWSTQQTSGVMAARRKAGVWLAQLPDIRRVMLDAEVRKEEAQVARRARQEERKKALERLDGALEMLRASGTCTKEQVATVIKQMRGAFADAEVLDAIKAKGMSVAAEGGPAPAGTSSKPRIEDAKLKNITEGLAFLGKRSLYDLLGMSKTSSAKSLYDTADERNRELKRIGRTDPENTERSRLYGVCMDLFRSDDEKEKYDNSSAFAALEELRPLLEIAGADSFITIHEQEHIVKRAREKGIDATEARGFIFEVARKRNWGVQNVAKLAAEELPQCGFCGALAKNASAKRCDGCGESLMVACPRCSSNMPTALKACTRCGCKTGDAPLVKALVREGEQDAAKGDFVAALAVIDRALSYWKDWEPAVAVRKDVVARLDAREKAIGEVDRLVAERKLVEARAALERVRRVYGSSGTEAVERVIQETVAQAEKAIKAGHAARDQGRSDAAIAHYERALELCADLAAARDALAAAPPTAPTALVVTPLRSGFHLAWRTAAGAKPGQHFIVVRKNTGRPAHHADGTVVGELSNLECDDVKVQDGVACYYAVFTGRGEVVSRESASAGPFLLASDVREAHALAGDGEVSLHWERPNGCVRVEVWRAIGDAPTRRGQGESLHAGPDGVQDSSRDNGKRYGYLVVAVYPDPARLGGELYAPGVPLLATPAAPPPPLLNLRAVRSGPNIILSWTPPPWPVQIRKGVQLPELRPGTLLPLAAAARFGTLVEVRTPGAAEVRIDTQGQVVFTPLTVAGANVVVGQPAIVATIEDVTNLRTQTNGREIVLTFGWPPGADEVLVAWRNDAYPGSPTEVGCSSARVTRAAYERNSGWELRVPKPERHYFSVFVKATRGDLYSGGAGVAETMGQGTTVKYRVNVKTGGFLSRTVVAAWIDLECSDAAFELPPLIVMGKDGQPPLSPNDGTKLADAPMVQFAGGRARIDLPLDRARASTFVKLFFADGRHAKEIRLMPGSNDELRVN